MMLNNFHPGVVLILVGALAALSPKIIRKMILACGPFLALLAMLNLSVGTAASFPFLEDYSLQYMYVDPLSWIFGFIFCIMAVIGGIYACHNENPMEALCCMSYAGSSLGVTFARDWISFIFFWELMVVTSLFLIWCNGKPLHKGAGFRYLLVHMFGGNLLFFGALLKLSQGHLMVSGLAAGPYDLAFWMILAGISINAAVVPVHAWLVDAYPSATITGSVFLSSFTTKVAVYGLIRIFAGTDALIWLGVLMAIYGACYAIMENDMIKLLSYHIISQVGFMVAGAGVGTNMALNGATAHAFSDILFKSLLFMCCNAIFYATGVRKINQLGGMAKRYPYVFVCFLIGAFSISGVPLFNGFISKNITIAAAGLAGYELVEVLLELASIGTLMSITFKMVYFIFLAPDRGVKAERTIPSNMKIAMGMGAALCTLYGVLPGLLYQYLPYQMQPYIPFTVGHVAGTLEMMAMAVIPFIMFLPRMEPHTALSIDFDWFYRKPLDEVIKLCSYLSIATCSGLGYAWEMLTNEFMRLSSNPMEFLDAKPFRVMKHYNPENYRTAIADPIMMTLAVLFVSICYFMTKI